MKIIIFLSLLCSLTVCNYTAFSASWDLSNISQDSDKTIKELKQNINLLNKDKKYLNLEFSILNKDLKLQSFFRENLSSLEVQNIKYIINRYLFSKNQLEESIIDKATKLQDTTDDKNLLFNKKKEFYKSLVPFIRKDKLKEYLEYISLDVKILKEKKDVDTKLIIKNEIISSKVEKIEEKIIRHRESLDVKFKALIEEKINTKIDTLRTNEKFKGLSTDLQVDVVDKVVGKIKFQISTLQSIIDQTDALSRKLEVYKILLSKLEEFKKSL
jgi:hypothetical protein